jgi:DNA repair protein RadC
MCRADVPMLRNADEAAVLLRPLVAGEGERLVVAHMDEARRLIALTLHSGGADWVALPLRDILAMAMKVGARGLILAHNHPSGDCAPSEADRAATRALAQAAAGLDVRLVDHIVFAGSNYASLAGQGLL